MGGSATPSGILSTIPKGERNIRSHAVVTRIIMVGRSILAVKVYRFPICCLLRVPTTKQSFQRCPKIKLISPLTGSNGLGNENDSLGYLYIWQDNQLWSELDKCYFGAHSTESGVPSIRYFSGRVNISCHTFSRHKHGINAKDRGAALLNSRP